MSYAIEWTGDPSGWDVENIFREYGIRTVGRQFRKGEDGAMQFRISVPDAQQEWADYVFKQYIGGGRLPDAWGVPTKAGPIWGFLAAAVGVPEDARRIRREARERRQQKRPRR